MLLRIDGIFIFGVLAVVASALVYPLPETHQKNLADTLGEAETKADVTEIESLNPEGHELRQGIVQA